MIPQPIGLQLVLDFLARTDLDGRADGPAFVWSILVGLGLLLAFALFVAMMRACIPRGPSHVTRVVVHRERRKRRRDRAELAPPMTWERTTSSTPSATTQDGAPAA